MNDSLTMFGCLLFPATDRRLVAADWCADRDRGDCEGLLRGDGPVLVGGDGLAFTPEGNDLAFAWVQALPAGHVVHSNSDFGQSNGYDLCSDKLSELSNCEECSDDAVEVSLDGDNNLRVEGGEAGGVYSYRETDEYDLPAVMCRWAHYGTAAGGSCDLFDDWVPELDASLVAHARAATDAFALLLEEDFALCGCEERDDPTDDGTVWVVADDARCQAAFTALAEALAAGEASCGDGEEWEIEDAEEAREIVEAALVARRAVLIDQRLPKVAKAY